MRRNIAIVTIHLDFGEFPDDFSDIDFANIGTPEDVDLEQLLDSLEQGMMLPRFR